MCSETDKGIVDTRVTLRQMVRDQLEKLQPWQRVEFIDSIVSGYCLECGEPNNHEVCAFMLRSGGDK